MERLLICSIQQTEQRKNVENTHSNCGTHTPSTMVRVISKRAPSPLSPEPSTDQPLSSFPPMGAALPAPTSCTLLDVFHPSWKPSLLMICFMCLSLSLRGLQFRCQLDSRPNDLISCSTFRRRWCCTHNRPVSRIWILFQSKSWHNALRYAAIYCNS